MLYYFPNRPLLLSPDCPEVGVLSKDKNWWAEIKKNGDRLVLRKDSGKFFFFNRHKKLLKYQPAQELLSDLMNLRLPDETQLDGELMHNKTRHIKHEIMVYDIYVYGNKRITDPLESRRDLLEDMFVKVKSEKLYLAQRFFKDFKKVFSQVIQKEENEGLVMKDGRGHIVWNVKRSEDVNWQLKIRKPSKNYKI